RPRARRRGTATPYPSRGRGRAGTAGAAPTARGRRTRARGGPRRTPASLGPRRRGASGRLRPRRRLPLRHGDHSAVTRMATRGIVAPESVYTRPRRYGAMAWSLGSVIREQARQRAERPMITYGARIITWSEMDTRTSRVGQALLAAGLNEQSRVAFLDKNGPEYFEILLGGGKANVVNVAVNWRLTAAEMAYVINDAGARLLVVGQDFVGPLDAMEPILKSVERIVVIGGHARHEDYETWIARHPAVDPGRTVAPTDVAMQLYTSGTTGLPKGAMIT